MATRRKKGGDPPSDSEAGRTNLLLEDIQKKVSLLAEGQDGLRSDVRGLEARVEENTEAIRLHGVILREHGEAIRELKSDVSELKVDVRELKVDVRELKADVHVLKADVGELKTGLARVEGKLDAKVDRGEHDALAARVDRLEQDQPKA